MPDEKWGEAVKAMVVLKPGAKADADWIIAFARTRLAAFGTEDCGLCGRAATWTVREDSEKDVT